MSYENPKQVEGINVTDEHPLRDLFVLVAGVAAISFVVMLLLSVFAQKLAVYVPFSAEQRIAAKLPGLSLLDDSVGEADSDVSDEAVNRERYLRELAQRLGIAMQISEPMTVTVHYSDDPVVNAYATLGGQIVIYAGLADKLTSENALAMLLAHEIAHVKLRHPIVATSRGLTVALALGTISGLTDHGAATQLAQWLGVTTTLSFNRAQESAADALAADALIELYGHLEGADELFKVIKREASDSVLGAVESPPEFLSTHPDLDERLKVLEDRKAELGLVGSVLPSKMI